MLPIGLWTMNNEIASTRGDRGDSSVVRRLAQGSSFAQARAEMEGIASRLAKDYPEANEQFGVQLRPDS